MDGDLRSRNLEHTYFLTSQALRNLRSPHIGYLYFDLVSPWTVTYEVVTLSMLYSMS